MAEERLDVHMPLFDRLVDLEVDDGFDVRPRRTFDRRDLRESVRRELERLLNTRSPLAASQLEKRELTVLEYGIPDFGRFSAASPDDRKRLAAAIERAIAAYEPRLEGAEVTGARPGADPGSLEIVIEAELVVDEVREPVTFPTVFYSPEVGRRIEVGESP